MMKDQEKKLSGYIDELNAGKLPKDIKDFTEDEELHRMAETVQKVRALREVEYPDYLYQKQLIASLIRNDYYEKKVSKGKLIRRTLLFTAGAAAAAVLLFVSVTAFLPEKNTNIVYAMEKAMKVVKAYHGIIEVTETNELGETMLQSKREVWADRQGNYYIKELEGYSQGLITVNNGKQKWQINPGEKEASLYSTFPDPYRFTFELGNEINDVKKAQAVETVGEEVISGREAAVLEVTPDGGDPYRLWVDNETDLPLQKLSAMQNALQYKVTYSSIEFIASIPQELLTYSLPEGYNEVNTNPEQFVTTIEEAGNVSGLTIAVPENIPAEYALKDIAIEKDQDAVKLLYGTADGQKTVVIMQSKASGEFKPAASAILGTVNDNKAEILPDGSAPAIRWQEKGMEYNVSGNTAMDALTVFAEGLSGGKVVIPQSEAEVAAKPQIEVSVDLAAEENEQKSVDEGHSPWKLDPVFVTQVFASLLLEPEGIVGDYPIPYKDIKIIENNGAEAKAEINNDKSIAKYVYLKRLVRQDDTGIWSVVGYDPVQ